MMLELVRRGRRRRARRPTTLYSLALGQRDVRLVALADDEHVVDPSGESVAVGVLDVDDVERSRVSLSRHDGSHSASVPPSSHHAQVAGIKLDSVLDLAGGDVYLDRVVHLDDGVRVSDGPAVSGVEVG